MPDDIYDTYDRELDAPVWGAEAIGQVLNLTARQAYHQLERKPSWIDADKVGGHWTSTRRRLLQPFTQSRAGGAR